MFCLLWVYFAMRDKLLCMITSTNNQRIKNIIALQTRRRARQKSNSVVIEGYRLVQDAVQAGVKIDELYYTETYAQTNDAVSLMDRVSRTGAQVVAVDDRVMQAISDTETPQGILAVLPTPEVALPESVSFALVVDRVADPGNLGTILRTAAAAGVDVVYLAPGTVDPYNPKVLRGGMGAHFRVPLRQLSWEGIRAELSQCVIFLADIDSGSPHFAVDWLQPCALIVSGEAHGPGEDALRVAHARITIPMPGRTESLNAAIAAAVCLFECVRQRTVAGMD